jgi:hypothetical protein
MLIGKVCNTVTAYWNPRHSRGAQRSPSFSTYQLQHTATDTWNQDGAYICIYMPGDMLGLADSLHM